MLDVRFVIRHFLAAMTLCAGPAYAADPPDAGGGATCALKGEWQDSTGYYFVFINNNSGIWGTQPGVSGYAGCPAPWKLKLRLRSGAHFVIHARDTNTDGCGQNFTEKMHFLPGCDAAAGMFYNAIAGSGPMSWVRIK